MRALMSPFPRTALRVVRIVQGPRAETPKMLPKSNSSVRTVPPSVSGCHLSIRLRISASAESDPEGVWTVPWIPRRFIGPWARPENDRFIPRAHLLKSRFVEGERPFRKRPIPSVVNRRGRAWTSSIMLWAFGIPTRITSADPSTPECISWKTASLMCRSLT